MRMRERRQRGAERRREGERATEGVQVLTEEGYRDFDALDNVVAHAGVTMNTFLDNVGVGCLITMPVSPSRSWGL